MTLERGVAHRLTAMSPRRLDEALALLGVVGAWWNASQEPHRDLDALAVVALTMLMSTVAWRRVNPILTTFVAAGSLMVFQVVSRYNGDGTFEAAAIAFNFYILGQHDRSRLRVGWSTACFVAWLAAAWVISYDSGKGSLGELVSVWALFGLLPFVCGFLLASRTALTHDLQSRSIWLDAEQDRRSRQAAEEERNRIARELHDVIAHCISVMVVQTSGARVVASADAGAAQAALRAVESAGRETLADLRRLVGTLRRGDDESVSSTRGGIGDIAGLVENARTAGLAVEFLIEEMSGTVGARVAAVAYRVVQEALTNAIKHAVGTRASVRLRVAGSSLLITVADSGPQLGTRPVLAEGSGQGLVGMQERVDAVGGELQAGPSAGGGFAVHARLPLHPEAAPSSERATEATCAIAEVRWPWLDWLFVGILLVILEVAVFTSGRIEGSLALNAAVVSVMGLATAWRRRYPLGFTIVVESMAATMTLALTPARDLPILAAFLLLVPTYALGAWANLPRATLGLIAVLGLAIADHLASNAGTPGDLLGAASLSVAAWFLGRAVRLRRLKNTELGRNVARLEAEGGDRTRLAVAGERSRLARELHWSLADSISAMIVQVEVARLELERNPQAADRALAAVEDRGRLALSEMRSALGSLRHRNDLRDLRPLPGVEQVYALIRRARDEGQFVELHVDGTPGVVPTTIELGLYRLVEEALQMAAEHRRRVVSVRLKFNPNSLELQLQAPWDGVSCWPTDTMRARIALCGGSIEPSPVGRGWSLIARLPRTMEGAFS